MKTLIHESQAFYKEITYESLVTEILRIFQTDNLEWFTQKEIKAKFLIITMIHQSYGVPEIFTFK